MNSQDGSRVRQVLSALLFAAIAAASYPLLSSGGLVFRTFTLDFGPVAPWIATGAALLLLSRAAAFACIVLGDRPVSPSSAAEGDEVADAVFGTGSDETGEDEDKPEPELVPNPLLRPTAIAQGLLQGAGGAVLAAGLLFAVAGIPASFYVRPDAPDLASLEEYLQIFASLVKWVFVAGALFAVTRVVKVLAPSFGEALPFPWKPAIALGAAYLLLASGGLLRIAFDFPGGLILAIIFLALALPYLAGVVRGVVALPLPGKALMAGRVLLLLCDVGWIVLVLGIMLSLPGIVDGVPALQEGGALGSAAPYLEILDTLAFWSIILLCPFILVRAIAGLPPGGGRSIRIPDGPDLALCPGADLLFRPGRPIDGIQFPHTATHAGHGRCAGHFLPDSGPAPRGPAGSSRKNSSPHDQHTAPGWHPHARPECCPAGVGAAAVLTPDQRPAAG